MKTIIMVAHPHMEQSNYNKELLKHVQNIPVHYIGNLTYTQEVIEKEQELLKQYDKIVFQYPIYWAGWPAAMQNYVENVIHGLFSYGKQPDKIRTFSFVITTGSDQYDSEELGVMQGQGKVVTMYAGMKYGGIWSKYSNEPINDKKIQSYLNFINQ